MVHMWPSRCVLRITHSQAAGRQLPLRQPAQAALQDGATASRRRAGSARPAAAARGAAQDCPQGQHRQQRRRRRQQAARDGAAHRRCCWRWQRRGAPGVAQASGCCSRWRRRCWRWCAAGRAARDAPQHEPRQPEGPRGGACAAGVQRTRWRGGLARVVRVVWLVVHCLRCAAVRGGRTAGRSNAAGVDCDS
jgi:hypothetical protein